MTTATYNDDDLVYVDPETRSVVGKVEMNKNGEPKSLAYKAPEGKKAWRKFYPWGTYRSMKGAFRIEGKRLEAQSADTLDDILPKFMSDVL
jgi:hypothetical protein